MTVEARAVDQRSAVTRLTGLVPPIATPFRDGQLDFDSLKRMLDHIAGSISGVLVGGSVGETPSLTLDERMLLMRAVAEHLGDDFSLAVSIADNAIGNSRRLSEVAGELGADLLIVSCPNYYTNDRRMLEEYWAELSSFASADLCLYDNPIASNTPLSVVDIAALAAATPRLTHIKVTDTAIEKVEALRRETSLVIHSGDDAVLWHQLARGAEGAMVALPMIYPQRSGALWRAFASGALPEAYEEYRCVSNFIHVSLGAPDYVAVIKTVLHWRGVIESPEVRLPLVSPSRRRIEEVIASL